MKGHLKNCSPSTHKRIEEHIRKHRARGGGMEAPHGEPESPETGDEEEKSDLKRKNQKYTFESKVNDESERDKAKHGGKMKKKKVVEMKGEKAHHHAGRKHRASGGSAEDHPFTAAHKGTQPSGRKVQRMTEGADV